MEIKALNVLFRLFLSMATNKSLDCILWKKNDSKIGTSNDSIKF